MSEKWLSDRTGFDDIDILFLPFLFQLFVFSYKDPTSPIQEVPEMGLDVVQVGTDSGAEVSE